MNYKKIKEEESAEAKVPTVSTSDVDLSPAKVFNTILRRKKKRNVSTKQIQHAKQ